MVFLSGCRVVKNNFWKAWIISSVVFLIKCPLYAGAKKLEGYVDVGVSVSFNVAPGNWLQSLVLRRVTLLTGKNGVGGVGVTLQEDRKTKAAHEWFNRL